MRANDREGWRKFVYRLLYPGVLGSMIFDLLDPLRPWSNIGIALFVIALPFIFDFLHMVHDLDVENDPKSRSSLDALIATLFTVSYFVLAFTTRPAEQVTNPDKYHCISLSLLALTYLIILIYEVRLSHAVSTRNFVRISPLVFALVASVIAISCSMAGGLVTIVNHVTIGGAALSTFACGIYVFSWRVDWVAKPERS